MKAFLIVQTEFTTVPLICRKSKKQSIEDMTKVIFGADEGSIITQLSASQVMFQIAETIAENVPGKNIVTSAMEHPSAYDAASYAAQKMGMELRVAKANPDTGGIDAAEVAALVDEDTCFVSIMSASNISGSIMDIKEIAAQSRKIKPDLYVITDAVQHAPHGVIDVKDTGVDAVTMAPYKFFWKSWDRYRLGLSPISQSTPS